MTEVAWLVVTVPIVFLMCALSAILGARRSNWAYPGVAAFIATGSLILTTSVSFSNALGAYPLETAFYLLMCFALLCYLSFGASWLFGGHKGR